MFIFFISTQILLINGEFYPVLCSGAVIACFALKKPELRICSNVGRKGADFHGLVPYVTVRRHLCCVLFAITVTEGTSDFLFFFSLSSLR